MASFDWLVRFWTWWMGELKALVPASLRHRFDAQAQTATWLRVAPDGLTLGGVQNGRLVSRRLEQALVRRSGSVPSARVSLRLDPALVFETTLTFPRQAEANLRQIVGHHLGLIIPMDPAALAFDDKVVRRDPVTQTVVVAVAVIKRTTLDRACEAARQAGFLPAEAVIDRAGEVDGRFNLLRHERQLPASKGRTLRLRALEAAALLLVLATAWVQLHRMDRDDNQLASRLAPLRAEAAAVVQLQREVQKSADSVAALQARRAMAPPLRVLAEVTRLLPDDTWITFLQAQDNRVELIGNSKHAASLIGLFEQSAGFSAPHFQSPVTTNPDGSEHFDLVVSIRQRAT
jgi:general secretion pathway protein L